MVYWDIGRSVSFLSGFSFKGIKEMGERVYIDVKIKRVKTKDLVLTGCRIR